jgi:hypothetical protein
MNIEEPKLVIIEEVPRNDYSGITELQRKS